MRHARLKKMAAFIELADTGIIASGHGDPNPPPQTAPITPEEISRKISAVETVQEQNEAASYQYYMQQQNESEPTGSKAAHQAG